MARRLAVVWGVHPVVTDDARDERDMAERACRHAYIEGFAGEGERMIIVAGVPFGTPGGDQQSAHRDRRRLTTDGGENPSSFLCWYDRLK